MNRSTDSYFSHLPTLNFPRSRFKQQTVKRLQSQSHGTLTPFFIDIVYPGDTWSIDTNIFARADISVKVPLDTIFVDTYYFFIPFRILDKDFEKILGGVDAYDTNIYSFPQITLGYGDLSQVYEKDTGYFADTALWFLPNYLNYHVSDLTGAASNNVLIDHIMAYGPMSYYMVFNEFFRDENVDNIIPIDDIKGNTVTLDNNSIDICKSYDPDDVVDALPLLQVNKYHDYFTSSILSPSKGPQVTLPLGISAPIITETGVHDMGTGLLFGNDVANGGSPTSHSLVLTKWNAAKYGNVFEDNDSISTQSTNNRAITTSNLVADLRNATAASINQFAIALKLEQLYQRRAIYGTRLTEVYRGQWGLNVPDDLIDRPEYLGGVKVDLNNIPVLNTTSSGQGEMVGNSATLFNDGGFTKSFLEYGIIIGLSCTRVKHTYTQGVMKRLHDLKDGIDLYNPVFAMLGPQTVARRELYNKLTTAGEDRSTPFAYQEAWADLREGQSGVAGVFDPMFTGTTEFKTYWSFADYYSSAPIFSADWLKESPANVCRTMSGNLISGAAAVGGHQYLFDYQSHVTVYRELPARSRLSLFDRY